MSDKGGIARLIISGSCCAAIMLCSFYNFIFGGSDIFYAAAENKNEVYTYTSDNGYQQSTNTPQEPSSSSTGVQNSSASSSEVTSSTSSLPTAAPGEVAGKVVEKFISPYTANTSYSNIYIKNSTDLDIDIKSLLNSPLGFTIDKNAEPQVLIVHTHTTETFMTENRDYYTDKDVTRTTDSQKNMVMLGKIVADKLNAAGIKTIHSDTVHDYPEYNGSYTRAAETICSYLEKYPSIKIVIDMHRDAISASDTDKVKLTTEINGKKAAQVMLVMGSQSGSVTNFPNWQENLKLAVRLQQKMESMYPSLARALSLMPRNYNESLTTGSILLEMGTDGNTIEEVKYSAELVANSLVSLLNSMEK